jgi:hypothetical protein
LDLLIVFSPTVFRYVFSNNFIVLRESQVLTFSEGTPDGGSTNANSVIPPLMTSIGGSSITALTRGSSSLTASLDDSLLNQVGNLISYK